MEARGESGPLSKGFSRIAFEALKKNPGLKISLVPVGLNYSSHQAFRGSVSVYFGNAIPINDYFNEPLPVEAGRLRDDLSTSLKQLTTHVENIDTYGPIIQELRKTGDDFLNPANTNSKIVRIESGEELKQVQDFLEL
ncbi:MAG: hypothetical protein WDN75_01835 [Bacteroidota bacterium]